MLNWLKWLIAPSEMAERERWRIACEHHSRWFAEFEIATEVLSRMQCFAESGAIVSPISDVRARFLAIAQTARNSADDTALLNWLRDNACDLRCIAVPTGSDDAELNWIIIEHHIAKPHEREIGRGYSDDPREAIRAAQGGQ